MTSSDFSGRIAVISGGCGGIGQAVPRGWLPPARPS